MQRLFCFVVKNLRYEKKDLNTADGSNRKSLGIISRAITNAIFLSHALRDNLIIRVIVSSSPSHIIQFDSKTIRYLGPEERSFGSLALKTEKAVKNNYLQFGEKSPWFEVNPGLNARLTTDPLSDIEQIVKHPMIVLVHEKSREEGRKELIYQKDFTVTTINSIIDEYASSIFIFDIDEQLQKLPIKNSFLKATIGRLTTNKPFDIPQLVSVLNYILDKKEKD